MYLLGADAEQLLEWADAPRKRVSVRAGYQRDLDDKRQDAITEFLELAPENFLPGAVLVAVRPQALTTMHTNGTVRLTIRHSQPSAEEARAILLHELKSRLGADELQLATDLDEAEEEAERAEEDESEEDIDTPQQPESYLAALTAELAAFHELSSERQREIDDFAESYVKPGLILDGQHRVWGAKDASEQIVLPIVLLPGLPPSEQVFHFYIINSKAKPLDKRQLRSIISTSLSKVEIASLYDRFREARVDADQAQWTYRVGTDSSSPFVGLINFGLRGEKAPIDDNVMDQVVSRFVRLPRKYNSLVKGVEQWDSTDYRFALFYTFWRAIKDTYPNAWARAAAGDGQLFYKVSMLNLQQFVLETLKSALIMNPTPFRDSDELYDVVTRCLERLPEEFFIREWRMKSLDTREGHELFYRSITEVVGADGKNIGNRRLFKGSM